jgi:mannose-6-phosphate isomerase
MPGAKGRLVEPGHQFEWGWLIARWALRRSRPDALSVAARLFAIGEQHGIDPLRNVAVMELDADFTVADPLARLWSQTEWLKAALLLATQAEGSERQRYLASAHRAASAIRHFLSTPLAGLWWDKQHGNGRFEEEPAPASTFYHLVSAIFELQDRTAELDSKRAEQ